MASQPHLKTLILSSLTAALSGVAISDIAKASQTSDESKIQLSADPMAFGKQEKLETFMQLAGKDDPQPFAQTIPKGPGGSPGFTLIAGPPDFVEAKPGDPEPGDDDDKEGGKKKELKMR